MQIPVYGRGGIVLAHTLVDDSDFEDLNQFRWCFRGFRARGGYVGRGDNSIRPGGALLMHRYLLGLEYGDRRQGDHRDRNHLNNQRSNLRILTNAGNSQNQGAANGASSAFRGVGWHKDHRRWVAYGRIDGKQYHLGYFDDELEAAAVASSWRAAHMPYSEDAI